MRLPGWLQNHAYRSLIVGMSIDLTGHDVIADDIALELAAALKELCFTQQVERFGLGVVDDLRCIGVYLALVAFKLLLVTRWNLLQRFPKGT